MEKELSTIAFPLISFFLLNSDFSISQKEYRRILLFFAVSVLAILLFTYIRSFFYPEDFFAHYFLTFGIIHPGYFSIFCAVVILIILEFNRESILRRKILGYLTILAILVYMTLLSSRMPLIAIVIILVHSIVFSGATVKRKLIYGCGIVACCLVLYLIITASPRLEYRFVLALEKNFETRLVSWNGSWEIFKEHWLFGVGTGAHQSHLDKYYQQHVDQPENFLGMNSHNYPLHLLMTFGVSGILLFAVFWFRLIRYSARHSLMLKVSFLFLICSITEVLTGKQKGIVFMYLFFTLHLLLPSTAKKTTTKISTR